MGKRERLRGGDLVSKKLRGSTGAVRANKHAKRGEEIEKKARTKQNGKEEKTRRQSAQRKKGGKGGGHQRVKCLLLRRTNGYRALAAIFGTHGSRWWEAGKSGGGSPLNRTEKTQGK